MKRADWIICPVEPWRCFLALYHIISAQPEDEQLPAAKYAVVRPKGKLIAHHSATEWPRVKRKAPRTSNRRNHWKNLILLRYYAFLNNCAMGTWLRKSVRNPVIHTMYTMELGNLKKKKKSWHICSVFNTLVFGFSNSETWALTSRH